MKLQEAHQQRIAFEARYNTDFNTFKTNWSNGETSQKYSYETEQDFWEWEASVTDEALYLDLFKTLP